MQCKKANRLFGSYLDGELTFEEEELLDSHLGDCSRCRTEFRGLQRIREVLLHLPQEDPGEEYTQAVMRRVRNARGEELAPMRAPLGERIGAWLGLWLTPKPAFGVALALILGLAAGLGVTQLTGQGPSPSDLALTPAPADAPGQTVPAEDLADLQRARGDAAGSQFGSQEVSAMAPSQQGLLGQRVEFVLEPYLVREGPQQVAEPLFPPASPRLAEGSRDGASITF